MLLSRFKFVLPLFALLLVYSVFSYALTLENLVLTTFDPYWQFQEYMWSTFLSNRALLAGVYTILVIGIFAAYYYAIKKISQKNITLSFKKIIIGYLLVLSPLLIAYNGLSTDVFNYIFNSRIIVKYQENPREVAPIEHKSDQWQRFMVNNYHPSPYGYGWLALAVIPYIFGVGKFITTWLAYKFFALLSLFALAYSLRYLHQLIFSAEISITNLALLFLNPLLIIEVVGNFHNDVWMMVPAILGIGFILQAIQKKEFRFSHLVAGLLLYLFSISIKLGTLALLPIVFVLAVVFLLGAASHLRFIRKFLSEEWLRWLPVLSAVLMFLPLFTVGSQRFHPWYFIWVLVWLPLIRQSFIRVVIISFTFSSMIRYIPWLQTGQYNDQLLQQQQLITFGVPLALMAVYLIFRWLSRIKS